MSHSGNHPLLGLTALEMRRGLVQGEFSATELCRAHLDRIEATNGEFNSFITVSRREAEAQSLEAEKLLREQGERSPALTGIPVAVKDLICTKGIRTTCASKILGDFTPPYDSTAVRKIVEGGGVIVGKTNLDEFGMGSSNENSAFGPVKNPWDLSRVPGGSSGGSAVAVAIGQAPLALGTDTGGSIRQPSSFTGVCGLKPTYGRVSRYGCVAYASSLDQIGPFARNVPDLAFLLSVIAGADDRDSTSMRVEVEDYVSKLEGSLKGLRVGIPKEYFIKGIDPEVEAQVRAGIQKLASLGAEIVEISLPHTEHALSVYYVIAPAEASSNLARYDGVRFGYRATDVGSLREMYEQTRSEGFGAEVKRRILIGTYVLSAGYYDAYYRKAQEVRTLIIDDFKAAFANHCDVIATPVAPTTAFRLGEKVLSPLSMYLADVFTIPVNLAGLPALALPVGADSQGLPVGLQLIGKPFAESTLLQVGNKLAEEVRFDTRKLTQHDSYR